MDEAESNSVCGMVRVVAAKIDAPARLLPDYGFNRSAGRAHIEFGSGGYSWVVAERGRELDRRFTRNPDELLYWVFKSVTASMASDWALRHRIADVAFRMVSFAKRLDLLAELDSRWRDRARAELLEVLAQNPDDTRYSSTQIRRAVEYLEAVSEPQLISMDESRLLVSTRSSEGSMNEAQHLFITCGLIGVGLRAQGLPGPAVQRLALQMLDDRYRI